MQTVEEAYESAAELYWIALLLTGCSDRSATIVIDEIERANECNDGPSILESIALRHTIIAKAIASIFDQLAWSSARMPSWQKQRSLLAGPHWSVNPTISREQLAAALLRIDVFPRCALLLTVFEGLAIDAAAALLQSDRELTMRGRITGLCELTRNLAFIPGLEYQADPDGKVLQIQI